MDGIELKSGGKYRITDDGDKVQLIVKGVSKDDAGDITCELSNSKGKDTAVARLRVQSNIFYYKKRPMQLVTDSGILVRRESSYFKTQYINNNIVISD